eukprot:403364782
MEHRKKRLIQLVGRQPRNLSLSQKKKQSQEDSQVSLNKLADDSTLGGLTQINESSALKYKSNNMNKYNDGMIDRELFNSSQPLTAQFQSNRPYSNQVDQSRYDKSSIKKGSNTLQSRNQRNQFNNTQTSNKRIQNKSLMNAQAHRFELSQEDNNESYVNQNSMFKLIRLNQDSVDHDVEEGKIFIKKSQNYNLDQNRNELTSQKDAVDSLSEYSDEKEKRLKVQERQKKREQQDLKREMQKIKNHQNNPFLRNQEQFKTTFVTTSGYGNQQNLLKLQGGGQDTAFKLGGNLPIFDRIKTSQPGKRTKSSNFQNTREQLTQLSKGNYTQSNFQTALIDQSISFDVENQSTFKRLIQSSNQKLRSKILKPTLSINQKSDYKSIQEKNFINSDITTDLQFYSTQPISLENIQQLTEEQVQSLEECLVIKQSNVFDYEDINEPYYAQYGKNYVENQDPPAVAFYSREDETQEYKIDRLRNVVPRFSQMPEWMQKLPQKERDDIMKSRMIRQEMNELIRTLQKRDTKDNVETMQKEMQDLQRASSKKGGVKKSISMYKIKQKMDQLQKEPNYNQLMRSRSFSKGDMSNQGSPLGKNSSSKQQLFKKQQSLERTLQTIGRPSTGHDGRNHKDLKHLQSFEDGRVRYKLLTNFVNAYKEKMCITASTGGGNPNQQKDKEGMSLQDIQIQAQAERNDITLDYEQFMRIYNFEKGRQPNFKNASANKEKDFMQDHVSALKQSDKDGKKQNKSQTNGSSLYKREKVNYYKPQNTSTEKNNHSQNRPQSTYSRSIGEQTRKLLKQTNEINTSIEKIGKSFIEGAHKKKKEEEDDEEIKRQVDMIKRNLFNRTSQTGFSRDKDNISNMNRSSQTQLIDYSPNSTIKISNLAGINTNQIRNGKDRSFMIINEGDSPLLQNFSAKVKKFQQRPQTSGLLLEKSSKSIENDRSFKDFNRTQKHAELQQNQQKRMNNTSLTYDSGSNQRQRLKSQGGVIMGTQDENFFAQIRYSNGQNGSQVSKGQSLGRSATQFAKKIDKGSSKCYEFINILFTGNVAALAQVYGDCISEMNKNVVMKDDIKYASSNYKKHVRNVNEKLQDISKDIRAEQIKYRKFDNYTRK